MPKRKRTESIFDEFPRRGTNDILDRGFVVPAEGLNSSFLDHDGADEESHLMQLSDPNGEEAFDRLDHLTLKEMTTADPEAGGNSPNFEKAEETERLLIAHSKTWTNQRQRDVFREIFINRRTQTQTAKTLGLPKQRIHDSLVSIRRKIKEFLSN